MKLTHEERRRQTMRMLHTYVDHLPVIESVSRAIVRSDDSELSDVVERLAPYDPTLAIRMLYLANHSFNGEQGGPVTLASVMLRIGAQTVADSIQRLKHSEIFTASPRTTRDLWLHSVQVAMIAKFAAQRLPGHGIPGDEAYLAGLLHDLGRFVMVVAAPEKFSAVNAQDWEGGDALLEAEQDVCGFDHATLGWLACRAWNFPEEIALVNRYHHQKGRLDERRVDARTAALIRMVGLADELSFLLLELGPKEVVADWMDLARNPVVAQLAGSLGLPLEEIAHLLPALLRISEAKTERLKEAS